MSNRTLLEWNHDYEWTTTTIATALDALRSNASNRDAIETLRLHGVRYLGTHHHSTPLEPPGCPTPGACSCPSEQKMSREMTASAADIKGLEARIAALRDRIIELEGDEQLMLTWFANAIEAAEDARRQRMLLINAAVDAQPFI